MSFAPSQILLEDEAPEGPLDVPSGDAPDLSPDRLLWHRIRSDRAARVLAAVIVALLLIAILAPLIVDIFGLTGPNVRNPSTLNAFGLPTGPSFGHPFGVDERGRDVFARVIYGARIPLEVGILGTALATAVGTAVGLAAGFYGGWIETLLMGIVDALLAFPVIVLGLGLGGTIGPGLGTVIFIVALTGFPYIARIVRRRVRALRERDFVLAARALGASNGRIISREILPSLRAPLLVYSIVLIPASILLEAALSFLGVGVHAPTADWGQMISGAGTAILSGDSAWWYLVFPGLALVLTLLAFNLGGNVLLDALGERTTRGREAPRTVEGQRMSAYIVRRVARAIVLLIAVTVLSFVLLTVLPGASPSPGASSSQANFLDYLKAIFLHFNFGYSDRNHQSVLSLIVGRLPATLSLIAGAGLLSVATAIPVGVIAAVRRASRFDRVATRAALGVVSMPVFWLGLILLYLFASDIGKIPIFPGANSYVGLTADPGKWFTSLILPWLALAAIETAIYSRLLRGQLRAVMGEAYVRSARARGVAEPRVVWRHGAVAAVAAVVAVLGLDLAGLLGGAVLTETAFRIHGIGLLSYDAVVHSDFATVQGTVLLVAMFIVIANLIIDVGFAWLDPRASVA